MSNPALHAAIVAAIQQAVATHFAGNPAQIAAQTPIQIYSFELGAFLFDQNPYSALTDLDLPTVFPGGTDETRRIRKTGVLRANDADHILPVAAQVPAGTAFPFFFEEKASHDDPMNSNLELPDLTAVNNPNGVEKYQHNIVKMVRIRYSLKNRPNPDGHPSRAWMLMLYSGGDA